jgi:hypothetical protein
MKTIPLGMLTLLFATSAIAEQNMNSVMFQDSNKASNLTTLPDSQKQDHGARCEAMAKEIEALKGKPQRRSVLSEQYRAECEMSR